MPRSRVRRQSAYTPPPTRSPNKRRSRPWVGPVMLVCFLLGVIWLALYYITNGDLVGMRALGPWNLALGFGFIIGGFGLSTQWR